MEFESERKICSKLHSGRSPLEFLIEANITPTTEPKRKPRPKVVKKKSDLAKNLKRGIFLYIITAFISILALTILANVALGGLAG